MCSNGWFGDDCDRECVHGRTIGKLCICDDGYGTANCSVACPGPEGNRCNGHGDCLDGHTRNATCLCDSGWYTEACTTYCHPYITCPWDSVYPEPHFQCNQYTGACECQRNASGHWAGALCNTCEDGYWGLDCSNICDCNGHGPCGWLDGVCQCYQVCTRCAAVLSLSGLHCPPDPPQYWCSCAPSCAAHAPEGGREDGREGARERDGGLNGCAAACYTVCRWFLVFWSLRKREGGRESPRERSLAISPTLPLLALHPLSLPVSLPLPLSQALPSCLCQIVDGIAGPPG